VRHRSRKRAVDILYEADMRGLDPVTLVAERTGDPELQPMRDYTITLVEGVRDHLERIDEILAEHSEGWSVPRMPAVDRAVLRLGEFELVWAPEDIDAAVVIDEAVTLVRSLSTDDSPRFVNAVLDRIAGIASRLRAVL
jgi:N utilization substance protein B